MARIPTVRPVGQPLDPDAVPAAGDRAQDVPGPLLAAQASATLHRPGGQAGEGPREVVGVPAALGEAEVPLPGQGDSLGDMVGPGVGAGHVAEADAGVRLDPGQQEQEPGGEGVRRAGERFRDCDHRG
jgi:hypothetical protein